MIVTITLFAALVVAVIAAILLFRSWARPMEQVHSVGSSPLDHAERILARRYAAKEITPEEYERMLTVLRR